MSKKNAQHAAKAAAAPETVEHAAVVVGLYGSDIQPAHIKIGDADVQLGTVVAKAHELSGLSVDEWNAQDKDAREQAIAETIDKMRAVAAIDFSNAVEPDDLADNAVQITGGTYVVNWHVKHGGKRYEPGDDIDLADDLAAPLLVSGAISAIVNEG